MGEPLGRGQRQQHEKGTEQREHMVKNAEALLKPHPQESGAGYACCGQGRWAPLGVRVYVCRRC